MEELKPCPFCGCTAVEIFPTLARGIFAVRCAACHMYGPHSENEDCAVERWNALPRRLRWTREKPKEDGFYWCRFRHPNVLQQLIAMVLVNAKGRYGITVGSSDAHDIDSYDGEWAGPIPEPE